MRFATGVVLPRWPPPPPPACAHVAARHSRAPAAAARGTTIAATTTTQQATDYTRRWSSSTKPQLDALWADVLKTNSRERLLLSLDSLLMELRSCRSLASHLSSSSQHTDPAWAAAGQQVAAECSRFERYISSSRSVRRRLQALQTSLRAQQQQHRLQQDGCDTSSSSTPRAGVLSLRQQLDLCSTLLDSMQSGAVEDSMQWLSALELPDTNVEQMQQLQQQERALVAAIDAVLSQAVSVELPAAPEQLLQQSNASTRSSSSRSSQGLVAASPQEQEQAQQPLIASVGKGQLARLLQQCADASVRCQLLDVLQPKLHKASQLLGQLAGCRQAQAALSGSASYYAYTQQRMHAAARDAHEIQFLLQLQESLAPLCQQEVEWVVTQAKQQQQQQQEGEAAAAAAAGPAFGPWDWDFLQHAALASLSAALRDKAALLQQHLQLSGVVAGFSGLLQDLVGLQLLPRAAAGVAEEWSPQLLVLDLTAPDAAVRGTISLDIGGGYGTRMLRYARLAPPALGSSATGSSLPAVAVGISGSRIALEQQQQQQQHEGTAVPPSADCVLSVAQLWELAHELGHAVHLVLSARQPACHLSGRFLPPHLLELPPQLMERLLLDPQVLTRLCLHHASRQPMPAHLSAALADYYGSRYNSPLAVSARVATSLAELMYGEYEADTQDCYWRGAWEAASGLPEAVAATGSLREVSLLPVMAAHPGTYHCYVRAWCQAAALLDSIEAASEPERKAAAWWAVFSAHVGSTTPEAAAFAADAPTREQLHRWLWRPNK